MVSCHVLFGLLILIFAEQILVRLGWWLTHCSRSRELQLQMELMFMVILRHSSTHSHQLMDHAYSLSVDLIAQTGYLIHYSLLTVVWQSHCSWRCISLDICLGNGKWIRADQKGEHPTSRYFHSSVVCEGGKQLVVFGGKQKEIMNDVHTFDIGTSHLINHIIPHHMTPHTTPTQTP